jgi:hypothetical protein
MITVGHTMANGVGVQKLFIKTTKTLRVQLDAGNNKSV